MFTIFRNAFSRYRGQILGWGISLGVLCLYLAQFYDTIAAQKEAYMKMVEAFPKELMAFFSTSEASEMFTPSGFLNIEFFSYMPIIIGIFAILAGSGMLAGDEEIRHDGSDPGAPGQPHGIVRGPRSWLSWSPRSAFW